MPTISDRDKRTLRLAAIGIAAYLVFFGGFKLWQRVDRHRAEYHHLVAEARDLGIRLQPYETKSELANKLVKDFHLDPAKLSRPSVVAEASAAIQKAAAIGGIQLGPIRETPGHPAAKELASMQLEGTGQIPAVMAFLQRFGSIGAPVLLDSIQINAENSRPGMIKVTMTVIILDYEKWKEEQPNA